MRHSVADLEGGDSSPQNAPRACGLGAGNNAPAPLQEFASRTDFDGLKPPSSATTARNRPRFSGVGCDRL